MIIYVIRNQKLPTTFFLFDYLGVRIDKEDTQESDINNRINKGRATITMLNSILWDKNIIKQVKLQTYNSIVRSTVTYGAEIWKLNKNLTSKLMSMEMDFLRGQQDIQDWKKLETLSLGKK